MCIGGRICGVLRSDCGATGQRAGDAEGEVIARRPADFTRADLDAALPRFLGRIQQVPPRHAALKHEGRAYYDYARAGVEIPRVAREVDVGAIEILDFAPPKVTLGVECGKGTYIRVLAEDLGAALGTCAHLTALRRTGSGAFRLADSVTLAALEACDPAARDALLLPVDSLLASMPRLDVDPASAIALRQGRVVAAPVVMSGRYRCYAPAGFVGTIEIVGAAMRPARLARTD